MNADRWLWAWLSTTCPAWRTALVIVKPETVLAWHRGGFRLYWSWKSRCRLGRPTVPRDVRVLIRTMSEANSLWGAPRIHGELLKLGFDISQASVAKYMVRRDKPPSQSWRTFLVNHLQQIAAADFFVVPTATCRLLFVLAILAHERRRVVHLAVTDHPTAAWTAQQLREAFPLETAPRFLLHGHDTAFHAWVMPWPSLAQAVARRPSICLNQPAIWFRLTKVWLTRILLKNLKLFRTSRRLCWLHRFIMGRRMVTPDTIPFGDPHGPPIDVWSSTEPGRGTRVGADRDSAHPKGFTESIRGPHHLVPFPLEWP